MGQRQEPSFSVVPVCHLFLLIDTRNVPEHRQLFVLFSICEPEIITSAEDHPGFRRYRAVLSRLSAVLSYVRHRWRDLGLRRVPQCRSYTGRSRLVRRVTNVEGRWNDQHR